jgi:hypothetical protein
MSSLNIYHQLKQPDPGEKYAVYSRPSWNKMFGNATWASEVDLESIQCPVDPGHQRAGKRIGDLTIVLPSDRVGDFVWTWLSDCLITDRVLKLFEEAGFTGFTVKPVAVKPKTGRGKNLITVPTLWELVVTGKGGDADPRSGIRRIYSCPHCGLVKYSSYRNGIIVDERTWDGSDFFKITEYPFILLTQRVKDFIVERGLTNCALIPSQDLVWSIYVVKPEDIWE